MHGQRPSAEARDAATPVRVLHLITEVIVGGAQDNTILSVEGLRRKGCVVDLASAPGGGWEDRARAAADRYFPMRWMSRGMNPLRNTLAMFETAALIRRGHYDVLHTHSTVAGLVGRWAGLLARVPVTVHTLHTLPGEDQTLPRPVRSMLRRLEWVASTITDRVIAVTALNRRQAIDRRIAPESKLVVVHSGVNMERFAPIGDQDRKRIREELGIPSDSLLIGWVGRMAPQNAPEVFVDVAERLARRLPEVSFVMIGDGPQTEEIERAAAGLPELHCLGYRADIPELLQAMDVFVSTVRWAGLGRALTEAMVSGVPVVTTAVGGVPDLVTHEETGLIVPENDAPAIAEAVARLAEDQALGARLGAAARNRVGSEFSADAMVESIAGIYTESLGAT